MAERWNPWRALRAREHVELRWVEMPAGTRGAWWLDGDRSVIALSHRLGRRERNAVLAHELVHDERRIAYTADTPRALVDKEEAVVDRIAARRLVPGDELARVVAALLEAHGQVTVHDLAEHFDVPPDVAERAAEGCATRLPGRFGGHGIG